MFKYARGTLAIFRAGLCQIHCLDSVDDSPAMSELQPSASLFIDFDGLFQGKSAVGTPLVEDSSEDLLLEAKTGARPLREDH